MPRILVRTASRTCPVLIQAGALDRLGALAARGRNPALALVVADANTAPWGARAAAGLREAGFRVVRHLTPAGESAKSQAEAGRLWSRLALERAGRDTLVVAVGGGVVGDLAGFAAATWHRGVDVIQVPTTLLAMVDAAIGGKTGINLPAGKNLVGAFHQPAAVVADLDTLRTLPPRHLRAGLAEVIKYGLIADPALFRLLERRSGAILKLDAELLARVVARCVTLKARVVAADEREAGERMLLNLGHTFGHAIEAATGFVRYLHGEAVGIGLVAASVLAERAGVAAKGLEGRVRRLVRGCGLPDRAPGLDPVRLRARARGDKKVRGGQMRYVVCRRIGKAEVREDLPAWAIASAWRACVTG